MDRKSHWESAYARQQPGQASWYQPHLLLSLGLISRAGLSGSAEIIDIGCGDSTLTDDLLKAGFTRLTVLEISSEALNRARARLGPKADAITWIEADILDPDIVLPSGHFDLWHDRAMFHFLTDVESQQAYLRALRRCLRPGGYAVIATFAHDGPSRCSGLPTARYDAATLQETLGSEFALQEALSETHTTPSGTQQKFTYCLFRRGAHEQIAR